MINGHIHKIGTFVRNSNWWVDGSMLTIFVDLWTWNFANVCWQLYWSGLAVRGAAPGCGVPAGEERGRLVGEAAQGEGQAALAQVNIIIILVSFWSQFSCRVDFQNWKDEEDVGDEKEPFEEVSGQCKNCKNIRIYLSQALIIIICYVCVGCIFKTSTLPVQWMILKNVMWEVSETLTVKICI